MMHTQYGLRPAPYYDNNDYPLPVIKSERTLNEISNCFSLIMGELTDFHIAEPERLRKRMNGSHGDNNVAKIAHRKGGMYLEYSDTRECSLSNVKASISMRMNRRPENNMTIDELIFEYGSLE